MPARAKLLFAGRCRAGGHKPAGNQLPWPKKNYGTVPAMVRSPTAALAREVFPSLQADGAVVRAT